MTSLLSLPFTLLHKCLDTPLLLRASDIPYSKRKKLRQLTPFQEQVVRLVKEAEASWLAKYWYAAQRANPEKDGRTLSTFIGRYYYGLIQVCAAHAMVLSDDEERFINITPFARLYDELNCREALIARIRNTFSDLQGTQYVQYPQVIEWAHWGQQLFTKQTGRLTTAEAWEVSPTLAQASVEDAAVEDYLIHLLGGNLLQPMTVTRASFLTLTGEVPESLILKACSA